MRKIIVDLVTRRVVTVMHKGDGSIEQVQLEIAAMISRRFGSDDTHGLTAEHRVEILPALISHVLGNGMVQLAAPGLVPNTLRVARDRLINMTADEEREIVSTARTIATARRATEELARIAGEASAGAR